MVLKSNVMINLPYYIMQHMIKCRDNDMPISYGCLITHLMLLWHELDGRVINHVRVE